jgi:hypothetical protein
LRRELGNAYELGPGESSPTVLPGIYVRDLRVTERVVLLRTGLYCPGPGVVDKSSFFFRLDPVKTEIDIKREIKKERER